MNEKGRVRNNIYFFTYYVFLNIQFIEREKKKIYISKEIPYALHMANIKWKTKKKTSLSSSGVCTSFNI